jgi:excisionase family DNA binding protein
MQITNRIETTPDAPASLPRLLLSPRDAAKALSISERTLFSISAPRGPLPVVKIGRSVRYHFADLEAYIESTKQKGGAL